MMFAILGMLMATLEAFAWTFRPNSYASANPITIGLPIVIAAGIVRRPANERTAILTFAAMLAASLNRGLIRPPMLVHLFVFTGAAYLIWWTYRRPHLDRSALTRFAVVVALTFGGFGLVWLWRLLSVATS